MRCIVRLDINAERYYLTSLFPCKWSTFISSAMGFTDLDDARDQLNSRHYQLVGSVDGYEELVNDIIIDTYENGKLISSDYYIRR